MVLRIILIVLICLLLIVLCYPLRLRGNFAYTDSQFEGKVLLCPFFTIKRFGIILYDSAGSPKKKQGKQKKPKKKENQPKSKEEIEKSESSDKPKKAMKPVSELILTVLNLLAKAGKGIKRIRVKLIFSYGFPDPALTGKITGAVYAALPWFFSGEKRCRWQVYLYPSWCPEATEGAVEFDIVCNVWGVLFSFGAMIPDLLKIIPKRKHTRRKKK